MINRPLIILASARKDSDTKELVKKMWDGNEAKLLNLLDFRISPYNYLNEYPVDDEFLTVIDEVIKHQVIVFATPVYWYAMSGLMKNFFDRFTEIVTIRKHLGRQLSGKSTFLIAVGADENFPDGFEKPFQETSNYLKMDYGGCLYSSTKVANANDELKQDARAFVSKINTVLTNR
jgi:multimeric flavodoxin WrbA